MPRNTTWRMVSVPRLVLEASIALPTPVDPEFWGARNDAHYAAQLIASAGGTLLEADPHFHYSSATLDGTSLVGEALPDGRRVRLDLSTLTVSVGDASLALLGLTMADAATWLGRQLGQVLNYPGWDMPQGPSSAYGPFSASMEALARLADGYALAAGALGGLTLSVGAADPARVWPHHFDIARLFVLQASDDPEESRSIGVGMTPGDAGIGQPYFYATPWPYPVARATPELSIGRWNTEGWYGAVLEADRITGDSDVATFLLAATAHLIELSEMENPNA